jgi:acetyl-CoA C-acetyltransferase
MQAYIVDAARTAGGKRKGRLSGWHPADLGGFILDALLDRTEIDPDAIEDVIFGCVQQVGQQSQNIARTALLSSRLPEHVPGVTIDRQCGSSQQAVSFAAQAVVSGTMDVVVAGGVESMTRVPMFLASTLPEQNGMGHYRGQRFEQRYDSSSPDQFSGAEMLADKHGLTKDEMDRYALASHEKAGRASKAGAFSAEIAPIDVVTAAGSMEKHVEDEGIRFDATLDAIMQLRPLSESGKLTAGTASQICDGAAAMLIVNDRGLKALDAEPLARIHHMSVCGGDPVIMLETPIAATQKALKKAGLSVADIDLFEVNEAFASVPLAWLKGLDADPSRLNVNGGAIALGHPLGASGARIMTTLIHALKARGQRYGLQTMCEGGGLANVTILEAL